MVTMETADNALKSFYLDAVTEAFDTKANPFLAKIQKTSADVVGKDVKKLVKVGLNGGIAAGSETGDLPDASSEDRLAFTSTLKNLYGKIEISDKAIRASASNEGAFVNLLNDEMQALIKSANYNFSRMLFGDGSGVIATVSGMSDTENVLTLDEGEGAGLMEGLYVDVISPNGNIMYAKNYKIVRVDREGGEVELSGTRDLSTVIPGEAKLYLHNSKDQEITGLKAIFNNSTIYGVDRTTNPALNAYSVENVGEISEEIVQEAMDKIEERSGSQVNFIVCSWGVKRALAKHFRESGVAMPTVALEGGFNGVSFNGIPVIADRFCPTGTMYLLNTDDFKLHQLCDWKWLEGEDGKVLKQVPGKPVYTATLVKYAELMCDRPNGQGRLTGITES